MKAAQDFYLSQTSTADASTLAHLDAIEENGGEFDDPQYLNSLTYWQNLNQNVDDFYQMEVSVEFSNQQIKQFEKYPDSMKEKSKE